MNDNNQEHEISLDFLCTIKVKLTTSSTLAYILGDHLMNMAGQVNDLAELKLLLDEIGPTAETHVESTSLGVIGTEDGESRMKENPDSGGGETVFDRYMSERKGE